MLTRGLAAALLAGCAGTAAAGAQSSLGDADAVLRSGNVFRAESMYYAAVARQPRDPAARSALGRYLAARGAQGWRVAAVLLEEARYFGGGADSVARWLAPVYDRLRDYKALAGLRGSPLSRAERLRVDWLARHPPQLSGPDSAWIEWLAPDSGLGAVLIVAGGDTIVAELDARISGLIVDRLLADREWLERFPPRRAAASEPVTYIATRFMLGPYELTGVKASLETLSGGARLGLDVLEATAPEFDPIGRRILLHLSGRVPDDSLARALPTVRLDGVLYVANGGLHPIGSEPVQALLRTGTWLLDSRRGEIRIRESH